MTTVIPFEKGSVYIYICIIKNKIYINNLDSMFFIMEVTEFSVLFSNSNKQKKNSTHKNAAWDCVYELSMNSDRPVTRARQNNLLKCRHCFSGVLDSLDIGRNDGFHFNIVHLVEKRRFPVRQENWKEQQIATQM